MEGVSVVIGCIMIHDFREGVVDEVPVQIHDKEGQDALDNDMMEEVDVEGLDDEVVIPSREVVVQYEVIEGVDYVVI